MKVTISKAVGKLGECIPSISLPPVETCREDAPCREKCYACKGRYRFPAVKNSLTENLEAYKENPDFYFGEIDRTLTMIPYRFFRYHVAGDIPDAEYFVRMCRLARKHKTTNFLCFTKKYDLVNAYIQKHTIPKNLRVVFSRWGSFPAENPNRFPEAYIKFKNDWVEIPENAIECPGYCGECVLSGKNCWNLEKGESVYFHQH